MDLGSQTKTIDVSNPKLSQTCAKISFVVSCIESIFLHSVRIAIKENLSTITKALPWLSQVVGRPMRNS